MAKRGGKSSGGYTSVGDMFDGGGPGQSGDKFEGGGAISSAGNALGGPSSFGGGGGYTSFGDRFDGGGPGRSGSTFQGGRIANTANALGFAPVNMTGSTSFRDMVDGGGSGQSGSTFQGGAISGLLNRAGVLPFDSVYGPNMPRSAASPFMAGGDSGDSSRDLSNLPPDVASALLRGALPTASSNSLTGEEASRQNAMRSMVPEYEEGGMVGPGGKPIRPSTRKGEIPDILKNLLAPRPSYAEGGMVGPGGMPQRPMASPVAMDMVQRGGAPVVGLAPPGGTGPGRPLNFAAIDMEAQRFLQNNPQQVAQIQAQVQQEMASGEIDAAGLDMFVQVATVALQNPSMWPQLRQSLISQGLLDQEDVSAEFDQGFLITLYIIGKTMGTGQGSAPTPMSEGQPTPMSQGQPPQMSMREGGALPVDSPNPDGSIPINAHEGEYVIPADVTRRMGTDHFDKLIAKARGMNEKGER